MENTNKTYWETVQDDVEDYKEQIREWIEALKHGKLSITQCYVVIETIIWDMLKTYAGNAQTLAEELKCLGVNIYYVEEEIKVGSLDLGSM
jgi:hypothetical protein